MDLLLGEEMHIKLQKLQEITNNFGSERIIGSGGFGTVYKGLYDGQTIAVKRLHHITGFDDTAFDNEFLNLCKIQHPNIVRLFGYCYDKQRKFVNRGGNTITADEMERVLCFEFVEGGNLERHMKAAEPYGGLNWPTCLKIIKDTCEGLHCLHSAEGRPICHLDLKLPNILLDKVNKTAKIGDLGLSRLVTSTLRTQIIRGTFGVMPPEYVNDGFISPMFDVYSLGSLIIKIMDGINGNNYNSTNPDQEPFIEIVTRNWKDRLLGTSGHSSAQEKDISQVETCIRLALRCVRPDRRERPKIEDIIHELKELEPRVDEISFDSADMPQGLIGLQDLDATVTAPIFNNSSALYCAAEDFNKKLYQKQVDNAWQPGNLINDMAKELDNLTKKLNNMAKDLDKW